MQATQARSPWSSSGNCGQARQIAQSHSPAGAQDSRKLRGRPVLVGESAKRAFAEDRVEACIREAEFLRVALLESDQMADAGLIGSRRRLLDVFQPKIDSDDFTAKALSQENRGFPLAARDIQDAHSRGQAQASLPSVRSSASRRGGMNPPAASLQSRSHITWRSTL